MFDECIGRMMKCFVKYFQFLTLIFFRLLTLVYDNIKINALIHDFFYFLLQNDNITRNNAVFLLRSAY